MNVVKAYRSIRARKPTLPSIQKGDFPVIQVVVLLFALIFVALTTLSDLLGALLDPRLRAS